MQLNKNWLRIMLITSVVLVLAACNTEDEDTQLDQLDPTIEDTNDNEESQEEEEDMNDGHGDMMHDESGELPEGLQEAENPTYPVGSEVIIEASHMSGMNGAEATISGAFDTIVYEVSYTPTDGSEPIENHRWVIHEEIEEAQEDPLEPGTEVTLNARHMEGMEGATATIDQAEETTIYMIDFLPTDGDEIIRNHQWVTEDELLSVE
jgi:hypothetical protein